jgi:elongation factor G
MTRETIAGPGEADTLLDRVLKIGVDETLHLKARARVRVTPTDRDGGIHTHTEPRTLPPDSRLSRDQEDAVRHGLDDALAGGPLEGAPLQDITAEVMEVELFGTASSPQALRMATSRAAREAMALAGGQRMQPLMNVEVVVPDENFGSVLGDLQARQTTITDTDTDQGMGTIRGLCPLSSLLGYTTDLRSMTRGRGQFTMEFCRFDVA